MAESGTIYSKKHTSQTKIEYLSVTEIERK